MGYATLQQVREYVAPGYGECDSAKVTKAVNAIRQHMFAWYQKLSLFLDAVECFRLQRFYMHCNDCRDGYLGITLPRDMQQIEAMWWNDFPVELQSSWREFQVGISPECDCRLQKLDMPGAVYTAVDIDPRVPALLRIAAVSPADAGKRMTVTGTASTGQPVRESFTLGSDPQLSRYQYAAIKGVIKDMTADRVIIAEESGRLLGIYEPDETVPSYKRVKITGLQEGCDVVNVRASRRYFPLWNDYDVVESDNQVVFDAMGRFLRLFEKASKDQGEARAQKDYYETAFNLMAGDKSREVGKATQATVAIASPRFGGNPRLSRQRGF